MFAVGMGPVADSAFSIATMLIAVPTGVKILNWISTLWGGTHPLHDARCYFSLGFIAMFTMGGLSRRHARLAAGRPAADRHLLRGGALPLRAVRRLDLRPLLGHLLLVAEDDRAAARRAARQAALLADADRLQPDVLPPALPRADRHAAAHLHLRARPRLELLEPGRRRSARSSSRSRSWSSSSTSLKTMRSGQAGRAGPVGRRGRSSGPSPRRRPSTTSRASPPSTSATSSGSRSTATGTAAAPRPRRRR